MRGSLSPFSISYYPESRASSVQSIGASCTEIRTAERSLFREVHLSAFGSLPSETRAIGIVWYLWAARQ